MDGLLLHDGFETYYAGKKAREEKSRDEASNKQPRPEALMARPAKWPPLSKDDRGEAANR